MPPSYSTPKAMMLGPDAMATYCCPSRYVMGEAFQSWFVGKLQRRLAGGGIGGHQRAAFFAEDHQAGRGGERAAPGFRRPGLRQFPGDFAGR